jgi:pro-sigmaK processing inhibitor BofA
MSPRDALALIFGGIVLLIVVRVFHSPLRWALRVMVNGVVGLVALGLWDVIFATRGWAIGLNPVTGATVGVLGPAGFVLLLAVKVLIL